MYKAYKRKKEFSEALGAYETYFIFQDSVLDKENQEYIQSLKAEFETERKEEEIKFLKKLNESEGIKDRAIAKQAKYNYRYGLVGRGVVSICGYQKEKRQGTKHDRKETA